MKTTGGAAAPHTPPARHAWTTDGSGRAHRLRRCFAAPITNDCAMRTDGKRISTQTRTQCNSISAVKGAGVTRMARSGRRARPAKALATAEAPRLWHRRGWPTFHRAGLRARFFLTVCAGQYASTSPAIASFQLNVFNYVVSGSKLLIPSRRRDSQFVINSHELNRITEIVVSLPPPSPVWTSPAFPSWVLEEDIWIRGCSHPIRPTVFKGSLGRQHAQPNLIGCSGCTGAVEVIVRASAEDK